MPGWQKWLNPESFGHLVEFIASLFAVVTDPDVCDNKGEAGSSPALCRNCDPGSTGEVRIPPQNERLLEQGGRFFVE